MNIDILMRELEKNKKVYNLALLYLLVKKEKKDYLLKMYESSEEKDVALAIKKVIYNDKETLKKLEYVIQGEGLGKGKIPSFKEADDIINKMLDIDYEDLESFVNDKKRR